jgi:hypothetical protein
VRNITDAGHITNSAGDEVDSIGKAARMEQMQPLEIVYKYNLNFIELQRIYNLLMPSIEPTATAHIQEQIEIIEQIISNGYAYLINGSVYFDTKKYMQDFDYGILSGRKVDELENVPAENKTKNGYLKDGFVVDSGDEDEDYESEDSEEMGDSEDVGDEDEEEINLEDIGSELSEDDYDYSDDDDDDGADEGVKENVFLNVGKKND